MGREDFSTVAEFIRGQIVAHTATSHPLLTSPSNTHHLRILCSRIGSKSLGEQTSPTALYPLTFAPSSFQYSSLDVLIYVSMCVRLTRIFIAEAASLATFQGNVPLSAVNHADSCFHN